MVTTLLLEEYFPVFVMVVVAGRLSRVIYRASRRRATHVGDSEKLSAYECGFNPFDDARNRFDIRFYLVAIRFIVFDLETSFMFPWARTLGEQTAWGYFAMFDFLVELVVGYAYAWKIGALEWE